jgi:hypothetical protein
MQRSVISFQEVEAQETRLAIDFAVQGSQLSLTKEDAGYLREAMQAVEVLKDFVAESIAAKRWRSNPVLVFGEIIVRLGRLRGYWAVILAQFLQRRRIVWLNQRS